MGMFYGGFAVFGPFATAYYLAKGQDYGEASGNAGLTLMLSGFAALESVVELRGCGVTFAQMSPLLTVSVFLPALVGRLYTGVLTQQRKVGEGFQSLLPAAWSDPHSSAAEWQKTLAKTFETLALDLDFFTTVVGTTFCQHILNACTFVMTQKGRSASLMDVLKYCYGGLVGTPKGGFLQLGKTFNLRFFFCLIWNMCSAQPVGEFGGVQLAIKQLEEAAATSP